MGYRKNIQKITKIKTLLPTLKEQQRYIVYRFKSPIAQDFKKLNDAVIEKCAIMLGMFDGAKAGLEIVKFNKQNSKAIVRVDNKYIDKLKVCLGTMTAVKIDNSIVDLSLDVDYVSGMVNKAVAEMNS